VIKTFDRNRERDSIGPLGRWAVPVVCLTAASQLEFWPASSVITLSQRVYSRLLDLRLVAAVLRSEY
jgi:hypothetical protein